ncbi:F-type H+-transporting ATPase subunit b [Desulfuromusa kysingii]|uniref:ATP synthase subunit b n=1 Tax=Desulfuromusa kysingii TaxID=37625 RepID=A0A1H4AKW8_9BACT|nr:ATP synthase F0 subunit B [Desulfuromusa kysingii]SEA36428.1 F-type H+-transporting ATPase subunit b [Desulfuromusa kysingii]
MISVDWTLGLQFLNFIILLVVLNKLLYRPIKKIISERAETISDSLATAKNLEADINEKMQRYQQQLSDAKILANNERNNLKKAAHEEEAKVLLEAQGKAATRMQAIKAQVGKEAAQASEILKNGAGSLAGQIATRILGREVA